MDEERISNIERMQVWENMIFLYLSHLAQLLVPILTVHFLTRRLSLESYGMLVYVQGLMTGLQAFVDYGFNTSAAAEISRVRKDFRRVGKITGAVIRAKAVLALAGSLAVFGIAVFQRPSDFFFLIFLLSSVITVWFSILLPDFLFMGLEKMLINAVVFTAIRSVSGLFKILCVTGDGRILLIPWVETVLTAGGIIVYRRQMKRTGVRPEGGISAVTAVRAASGYFLADFLPAVHAAMAVVVLGAASEAEAAVWGLAFQLYSAVLALGRPLRTAVFPFMARGGKRKPACMLAAMLVPAAGLGCVLCWYLAGPLVSLLGGEAYMRSAVVFKRLLPALFMAFPSMALSWFVFGAEQKCGRLVLPIALETAVQLAGLLLLLAAGGLNAERAAYIFSAAVLAGLLLKVRLLNAPEKQC